MAISDTTKLTDKLMAAVRKREPADALNALGFLIVSAANEIVDTDGVSWSDRKRELLRSAEFCSARAAQCLTDEQIQAPIADIPDDPDEDII